MLALSVTRGLLLIPLTSLFCTMSVQVRREAPDGSILGQPTINAVPAVASQAKRLSQVLHNLTARDRTYFGADAACWMGRPGCLGGAFEQHYEGIALRAGHGGLT